MGGLLRCDACGTIRWNVLGQTDPDASCETCGAPLKPERRRPGRKFRRQGVERRDLTAARPPFGTPRV